DAKVYLKPPGLARTKSAFYAIIPNTCCLWMGTSLNPALHSLASISLFQHRAVSVAEVDQAIEHGQ
ncbi:hypothetical protein, partial [Sinorhizobium meliloti]|uniref:hypothetical protein n=1 Tax=Rhizobium meliloti TaxID=382 RepID=UPI001AEC98C1